MTVAGSFLVYLNFFAAFPERTVEVPRMRVPLEPKYVILLLPSRKVVENQYWLRKSMFVHLQLQVFQIPELFSSGWVVSSATEF